MYTIELTGKYDQDPTKEEVHLHGRVYEGKI